MYMYMYVSQASPYVTMTYLQLSKCVYTYMHMCVILGFTHLTRNNVCNLPVLSNIYPLLTLVRDTATIAKWLVIASYLHMQYL